MRNSTGSYPSPVVDSAGKRAAQARVAPGRRRTVQMGCSREVRGGRSGKA